MTTLMFGKKSNSSPLHKLLSDIGPVIHLSEKEITLRVASGIEGSLSLLGKAPRFKFQSLAAKLNVEENGISGTVELDIFSLSVVSPEVTDADRQRILKQVHERIFETSKYEKIQFDISEVSLFSDESLLTIKGDLHFHGVRREIEIPLALTQFRSLRGGLTLRQSDFGVVPLVALAGMLRSKDEVEVSIEIALPLGS